MKKLIMALASVTLGLAYVVPSQAQSSPDTMTTFYASLPPTSHIPSLWMQALMNFTQMYEAIKLQTGKDFYTNSPQVSETIGKQCISESSAFYGSIRDMISLENRGDDFLVQYNSLKLGNLNSYEIAIERDLMMQCLEIGKTEGWGGSSTSIDSWIKYFRH